jgi:anti-sigma B factor antagonist
MTRIEKAHEMQLTARKYDDGLLIVVNAARICAADAIQFKDRMRELTIDAPDRVVLDMSQVTFVDSSGLGALIACMKQIAPERVLELAGLTPTVEKVFALSRLDTIFKIHASPDDLFEGMRKTG